MRLFRLSTRERVWILILNVVELTDSLVSLATLGEVQLHLRGWWMFKSRLAEWIEGTKNELVQKSD